MRNRDFFKIFNELDHETTDALKLKVGGTKQPATPYVRRRGR
jgi:hypothetical protein